MVLLALCFFLFVIGLVVIANKTITQFSLWTWQIWGASEKPQHDWKCTMIERRKKRRKKYRQIAINKSETIFSFDDIRIFGCYILLYAQLIWMCKKKPIRIIVVTFCTLFSVCGLSFDVCVFGFLIELALFQFKGVNTEPQQKDHIAMTELTDKTTDPNCVRQMVFFRRVENFRTKLRTLPLFEISSIVAINRLIYETDMNQQMNLRISHQARTHTKCQFIEMKFSLQFAFWTKCLAFHQQHRHTSHTHFNWLKQLWSMTFCFSDVWFR